MTVDQVNSFYVVTIAISLAAIVSGLYVLWLGTYKKKHYYAAHGWAYLALICSIAVNVFFSYNIILWLSDQYTEIRNIEFHIRWLIYHSFEKTVVLLFHHDLFRKVRTWRNAN